MGKDISYKLLLETDYKDENKNKIRIYFFNEGRVPSEKEVIYISRDKKIDEYLEKTFQKENFKGFPENWYEGAYIITEISNQLIIPENTPQLTPTVLAEYMDKI